MIGCEPLQLSPVSICWLLTSTNSLKDTLETISFEEHCQSFTSVANCCNPPILMGPSSEAYRLQPPTHSSDVGQTIPQVRPKGLSERMARAAP